MVKIKSWSWRFAGVALLSLALLLIGRPPANATSGINQEVSFEGKIVNTNGTNIPDGNYNLEFKIYAGGTNTGGGTPDWTGDYLNNNGDAVNVSSGTFEVDLGSGSGNAFGGSVNWNSYPLYLSINVGNTNGSCSAFSSCSPDGEMSPYILLDATPYSLNSNQVGGLTASQLVQLTPSSQQSGSINVSGNIASGGTVQANTIDAATSGALTLGSGNATSISVAKNTTVTAGNVLTVAGNNGLTLGSTTAAGGELFQDGTSNNYNVTLTTPALTGSYILSLPTTGPGTSQCLQSGSVTASQLAFGSCGGALQQAYNAGNSLTLTQNTPIDINDSATPSTTNLLQVQNNSSSTTYFGVSTSGASIAGGLVVNSSDSSISRDTSSGYSLGTVGANLNNSNNELQLADGTPSSSTCSGCGVITSSSQPTTAASIGAGSMTISRTDGKYFLINGGAALTTAVFDSVANTFTASTSLTVGAGTGLGAGAIALPRPNGQYLIILGQSASTTSATSMLDPNQATSAAGPTLATAITGAGTTAFKRADGKYLITNGVSTPVATTQIYDPVANSLAAGPSAASGTWSTGAAVLPRPDGNALIVEGGSNNAVTQFYNYTSNTLTAGPSLDGNQAANTCSVSSYSVAFRRQDGDYVILTRANAEAIYDPVANTITCKTSVSNVSAIGDGGQAIPLQNGNFLILAGGNTTTAFVYNQSSDSFSSYTGGTGTAITTGAQAIFRQDGSWQILAGGGTASINFNTNLPMNDPYPSPLAAATPTSGGSCNAGLHSYFVTFVTNGVESEASARSNEVACTAANGTVALSNIPIGSSGTTSRKIYRTNAGDNSTPLLIATIANNTATTATDTSADCASSCTSYSATASGTWYTSEAISSSALNQNSTLNWTAQKEATLVAARQAQAVNTDDTTVQFLVRTAVNGGSGCASALAATQWNEVQNPGDLIHPVNGANCVQWSVHFNRSLPKRLIDDRGTWFGDGNTTMRLDYVTPTLFNISVDNDVVLRQTSWDFDQPDSGSLENPTVPAAPSAALVASVAGSCSTGTHVYAVTFVTNGVESSLGTASGSVTCTTGVSGSSVVRISSIPIGPSGTTARKIYRTAANGASTSTFYLLQTVNDNSTTTTATGGGTCAAGGTSTNDDYCADTSLAAAYASPDGSGGSTPTLTRAEGTRVESVNNQLTLPYGRLTQTTQLGTSGYYAGLVGGHAPLPHTTTDGTVVLALPNKTFLILESGGAFATIYDPNLDTFTDQSGTGNVPTASIAAGAFAIKRPDGKFLVAVGGSSITNIYDPNAPNGSHFTAGPSLTTAAGIGAYPILNADGTWTIVSGNAATATSLYDPVTNAMTVGPTMTTASNCGGMAIPLGQPYDNQYKVIPGAGTAAAAIGTVMNYDAVTKTFTAGTTITTNLVGCGATAFQRQDGIWVIIDGESSAAVQTTSTLLDPKTGITQIGPALTTAFDGGSAAAAGAGHGETVIPRADGTFLITAGGANASAAGTLVYVPWDGVTGALGVPQGGFMAGPSLSAAPSTGSNVGSGAISFQRPDGKWMILTGQATSAVDVYDAGWYADGQYLSEEDNVPALGAAATLDWQQTSDQYVRFEAKAATSQAGLSAVGWSTVDGPGGSIGNAGGETWAQVEINMRRDFPTFGFDQNGVYLASGGQTYAYRTIAQPTVNNYEITNGSNLLNLQDNGLSVLRVTSDGNIMSSSSGGFFSGGADLAENYSSTQSLTPGQVVISDPDTPGGVLESTGQYQPSILGVVSTDPGFVAGAYTPDSHPIALVGRVPVNVSTENGPINQGDYLTSGSIPGYAMKATQSGRVIGQALASFDPSTATACPTEGAGSNPNVQCGSILMFVNMADYNGESVQTAINQEAANASNTGLNIDGSSAATDASQAVGPAILGMPGLNTDGSVPSDISNSEQILSFLDRLNNSESSSTTSEVFTGQVSASKQVITPTLIADNIIAKSIKADQIEGLQVFAGNLDSLTDKVAQLSSQTSSSQTTSVSDASAGSSVDLSVLGQLQAQGGLLVTGDSEFAGNSIFDKLATFFGDVIFHGNVSFDNPPLFSQDSAGYAVIHKGIDRLNVNFSKPYINPPLINATITLDAGTPPPAGATDQQIADYQAQEAANQQALLSQNYNFIIYGRTPNGFSIILNKPASDDLLLSWSAVAVNNPQIYQSAPTPLSTTSGSGTN